VPPREDFEQYVAARMPALLRTAYLLTGHQQDAEDLVQVAMLKTVGAWRRIAGDPDAYVRQVLVNENISRWRRRRWREVLEAPPESHVPSDDIERRMALRSALMSLAPKQRTVLVLRYYEGLSEREIADAMGIGAGTVKSHARDALARLRATAPDLDPAATLAR